MTFRDLYICNDNYFPRKKLLIRFMDKLNCKITKEIEIDAFGAKNIYGNNKVVFFENDIVTLWSNSRP